MALRVTTAAAVAGATLATALAGGTALAETGQAAGQFPKDFLLYESEARKPVDDPTEEKWTISNKLGKNPGFSPCDLSKHMRGGQVSARTVGFNAPLFYRGEQLVVYRSESAARSAFAGLLKQARKCAKFTSHSVPFKTTTQPVKAGDQAVRVAIQGGDHPSTGKPSLQGQRAVVMRKGRAVAVYLLSGDSAEKVYDRDFTEQLRDARKMAGKVCSLPGVC
ncbi:hypothetical protein FHS43_003530 [Streptosporangium becharense]|uniref:PknH-like extracellular domain-containing protein n=1 Tax=Streptosporangium becharense TaxID=1816182 RepID=A0A7W9IDP0_9ACTN|nr:hypothetical protein [Streptosporangium becharense]MBB2912250.1 hypothetical protein [Streptosporangium becharense]MBB5818797.1 hypothetical protein [Streptosporangium becharense]